MTGREDSKVLPRADRVTPPNAGKGRVKGVPNKMTKALKEMILGALDKAGGEDYLVLQAQENPTAFLTLIGKVLPTTLSNDPDNPMPAPHVTVRFLRPGDEA